MVKHGSSQLRYVLLNACLPLIRFDLTFATYYAKKRAEGKKTSSSHYTCSKETDQSHLCIGEARYRL